MTSMPVDFRVLRVYYLSMSVAHSIQQNQQALL
jgi:hypothetical protein